MTAPHSRLSRNRKRKTDLHELLGLDAELDLAKLAHDPQAYHPVEIPKRSGGRRQLCVPCAELFHVQSAIVERLWPSLRVHAAAHGFVEKRSIVTHAATHRMSSIIATLDLKDFFGSIELPLVRNVVQLPFGFDDDTAQLVARLCCRILKISICGQTLATVDAGLPQGAPTSPTLSNACFRWYDYILSGLAWDAGCRYTRFVDDIAFSLPWNENPPDAGEKARVTYLVDEVCGLLDTDGFLPHRVRIVKAVAGPAETKITGLLVGKELQAPAEQWVLLDKLLRVVRNEHPPFAIWERARGLAAWLEMVEPEKAKPYVEALRGLRYGLEEEGDCAKAD